MNRTAVLPIALVAALGLSACGSGHDGTATTTDVPASTQAKRAPAPAAPSTPADPGKTTAADPATAPSAGTTVSGTGYRFSLASPGWTDAMSAAPKGVDYDRFYARTTATGGRRVIETMLRPVPAAEAASPTAFDDLLQGMRNQARTNGMTLGRPSPTTLGGERAFTVSATGRTSSGGAFTIRFVMAIHGSTVYSVAMIAPTGDRAASSTEMEAVRRSWTFTDGAAPAPDTAAPEATSPGTAAPGTGVPAWRPGVRRA